MQCVALTKDEKSENKMLSIDLHAERVSIAIKEHNFICCISTFSCSRLFQRILSLMKFFVILHWFSMF